MSTPHRIAWVALSLCFAAASGVAAQTAKKPLDHSAYDIWNRVVGQTLSDDGVWALYTVTAELPDGTLYVRNLRADTEHRIGRGEDARFTEDARFVVFKIKPMKEAVKQARKDKVKPEQMPQDSLGILDLNTGNVVRFERVQSFRLPDEASGWLAYQLIRPNAAADSTAMQGGGGGGGRAGRGGGRGGRGGAGGGAPATGAGGEKRLEEGSTLVVRNLASGQEQRIEDVSLYTFAKNGSRLAYARSNKEGTVNGAFLLDPATSQPTPMLTGKGNYRSIAFDDAGQQITFLSNKDTYADEQPAHALFLATVKAPAARVLAKQGTAGMAEGWWVSENEAPYFSRNGQRVFFGTAPRPVLEKPDSTPEDERVRVDIWNWKDPYLQPMQLRQLDQERRRTYTAAVQLKDGKLVQLADQEVPAVEVGRGDLDVMLASSALPYRQEVSWDGTYSDVYLVDARTGARTRIMERKPSGTRLSPDGKYITWYDSDVRAWFAMSLIDKKPINLSKDLKVATYNEQHDSPSLPSSYGTAGWTTDGKFLIYDAYDIWAIDPTGKTPPRSVTEETGRRNQIRFRYVSLDPEEEAIRPDAPLLLSAFHTWTKAEGFYRDQVSGSTEPQRLVYDNRSFGNPVKADDAGTVMFTRSTFQEFPDVHVSDLDFRGIKRISDANPQQSQYTWGSSELVEWKTTNGETLQGILHKPEGFDPTRKYPMMVYFYERLSDGLHNYTAPSPGGSSINTTFYVSRGYLVFEPDIPYRVGYPGESAMNAVVPGVLSLMSKGIVDEKHIGVQGHSWGGYQIAYMVTKTNIFAAAEAGAPVANMISAYGGIRWSTGMSRQFQYEKTQSRIGGTLWDEPLHFLENSPIFWADKVRTPLLMMHNDEDGAVPWYQGIEYFTALRRLGQPAWMVNYNGEDHGLRKMANRKDWTIRMQQFFDHYLKGDAPPVWLAEGVPAVKKGKTMGLELITDKKPAKPIT